ncbi:Hypothetical predicted protein [Podarcis lilfordi]|uniref:Uncharacterized protein n=1 Tax=Podarcis lilfordi TaxID=74358 RepID=A0AA35K8K6_9SAUR|nr:Hypothetical predicted protein [Podarcis lilfordi]
MGRLFRWFRALFSCQQRNRVAPLQVREEPVVIGEQDTEGDILGHLERFRDQSLSLALALEALLQLSIMRPKFNGDMRSAILHRTFEAVLKGAEKVEDREALKQHFHSLLGGQLEEKNERTWEDILGCLGCFYERPIIQTSPTSSVQ